MKHRKFFNLKSGKFLPITVFLIQQEKKDFWRFFPSIRNNGLESNQWFRHRFSCLSTPLWLQIRLKRRAVKVTGNEWKYQTPRLKFSIVHRPDYVSRQRSRIKEKRTKKTDGYFCLFSLLFLDSSKLCSLESLKARSKQKKILSRVCERIVSSSLSTN